ncbi:MAG: peroxiredoxin [Candidatus Parvarchaeota archaeon]|nr:peroxiredoxin [Candidatus Parvarchaeota archaeon]
MKIKEGDYFPDFSLPSDEGNDVSLSSLKGRTTVIYFYPRDDTPGCTKEACSFRDNIKVFESMGVPVYGISVDSIDSHKRFKEKFNLPFPLLSDVKKSLVVKLGIKSILGIASRVTFVLDKDGKIIKIYPKVSPDKHALELIKFLQEEMNLKKRQA